jgi:uncharacterized protein (TIGR00730 family)
LGDCSKKRLEGIVAAQTAPGGPGSPGTGPSNEVAEELVDAVLEACSVSRDRDLARSLIETACSLVAEHADTLDLKIANAALGEMAEAFRVFRPYRPVKKVTFFGSARTERDDPRYVQASKLAHRLAHDGWMVVTGAGPGIMEAAMHGAGRESSLGVNIRLPHEQGANAFIAQDPKLVEMRYFFTRKLMLIKESDAYVVLPGGFGTLDEGFELLTLLQTGKAQPAPVVLLDVPGDTYWQHWEDFVAGEVLSRGLIDSEDRSLYKITSEVAEAHREITAFYSNYHSCRWVGDLLVIRLRRQLSRAELSRLTEEFSDILKGGSIRSATPLPPERASNDHLDLARVALRFDRSSYGRLRQLIDRLNEAAPDIGAAPGS